MSISASRFTALVLTPRPQLCIYKNTKGTVLIILSLNDFGTASFDSVTISDRIYLYQSTRAHHTLLQSRFALPRCTPFRRIELLNDRISDMVSLHTVDHLWLVLVVPSICKKLKQIFMLDIYLDFQKLDHRPNVHEHNIPI